MVALQDDCRTLQDRRMHMCLIVDCRFKRMLATASTIIARARARAAHRAMLPQDSYLPEDD